MTRLVVDAGVVIKAIVPNEAQGVCLDQLQQWQRDRVRLCAPSLWAYEVTSAFSKMAHFGQISAESAREGNRLAFEFGVELVYPTKQLATAAFAWTARLKRAASYDSFYLAVATELKCELWTTDRKLMNAVGQPWVHGLA